MSQHLTLTHSKTHPYTTETQNMLHGRVRLSGSVVWEVVTMMLWFRGVGV